MAKKIQVELVAKDSASKKVQKFTKTSTSGFQKLAGPLGIGAVAIAFTALTKKTISYASNLEEVQNKFSVVFKDQQKIAEGWAKTLVDSYMMSTREAKQYLASVQDLLVPMGMASDEAGRMANEVVKLSADLGSFNNLPTAKVMEDIQSALVGNFETMKKYGVVLKATVVEEKALAMGLADTKDALTASHKAQAAYTLIVEGSTAAIGDSERSADSYANVQKELTAAFENLGATLGNTILPLMASLSKDVVGLVNDLNILLGGDVLSTDEQIKRLEELQEELLLTGFAYDAADIGITATKKETEELLNVYKLEIMALKERRRLLAGLEAKKTPGAAATPTVGASKEDKDAAKELEQLWEDIHKSNVESAIKADEEMADAYEGLNDFKNEQDALRLTAFNDYMSEMTAAEQEHQEQIREGAVQTAEMFASGFTDAFMSMIDGTKTVGEAFKDMALSIIRDLARMAIQAAIFNAIMGIGGRVGSTGVGATGTTAGGAAFEAFSVAADGGVFPGGFRSFAAGGTVTKPTLGLVGEGSMNEAVVPLPDGRKIPVDMKGGGSSEQPVNITINAVDSKSFAELTRRNPAAIVAPIMEQIHAGNMGFRNTLKKGVR